MNNLHINNNNPHINNNNPHEKLLRTSAYLNYPPTLLKNNLFDQ